MKHLLKEKNIFNLHKNISAGEIVGPVVGGALYEVGGFTLPFAVMGSILALSSIFIYFVLPDTPQPPTIVNESVQKLFNFICIMIIRIMLLNL